MYHALKEKVLIQNKRLVEYDLITLTWGNVSEIDREQGVVAIKPSGVSYDAMNLEDIVIVDLNGTLIEGTLNPSSDLETHLCLYRADERIGGVVHTHSPNATAYAQAGKDISALGTTHADTFNGTVPCSRKMKESEIVSDYELNTGHVIVETFRTRGLSLIEIPACLVQSHGPFVWGADSVSAVENALVLETVAKMNFQTEQILGAQTTLIQSELLRKHYERKHGEGAYYGQER